MAKETPKNLSKRDRLNSRLDSLAQIQHVAAGGVTSLEAAAGSGMAWSRMSPLSKVNDSKQNESETDYPRAA